MFLNAILHHGLRNEFLIANLHRDLRNCFFCHLIFTLHIFYFDFCFPFLLGLLFLFSTLFYFYLPFCTNLFLDFFQVFFQFQFTFSNFFSFTFIFPFLFGHLFPFSLWTFIFLFSKDFYLLFGLLQNRGHILDFFQFFFGDLSQSK